MHLFKSETLQLFQNIFYFFFFFYRNFTENFFKLQSFFKE